MNKALCFGSLNTDVVYSVPHIIRPGETLSSLGRETYPGGKGLNQAVALSRAGLPTAMAGQVGSDGAELLRFLGDAGVDTSLVRTGQEPTGHALVQVDPTGANCIIVHGGANRTLSEAAILSALESFGEGDLLLVQNETNLVGLMVDEAARLGMTVAYNPSPFDQSALSVDIDLVDYLFVNEVEAESLTGTEDPDQALEALTARFPSTGVILTLGAAGAAFARGEERVRVSAAVVDVVDTTAAGDTFTGYFLAQTLRGGSPFDALSLAVRASGVAVGRQGAAVSIPRWEEVPPA